MNDTWIHYSVSINKIVSAKSISVKPLDNTETDFLNDAIEEINDMIKENKPFNYELDSSITYDVDIGGNIILI